MHESVSVTIDANHKYDRDWCMRENEKEVEREREWQSKIERQRENTLNAASKLKSKYWRSPCNVVASFECVENWFKLFSECK